MVDQRSYVIVTTWVLEQWQLGVLGSLAAGTLLGSHLQLTEASTEQAPKGGGALAPRSCSQRRLVHGPAPAHSSSSLSQIYAKKSLQENLHKMQI